ncbi:hypothetical protein [Rhizobium miluonense]|uniref:Uncharacterized protein n=1 Tax=Rhizobium miluonense TaxID=411945 RepID=A0ABU1SZF0_9HYPH|nr:hypothetical protein [Rhizobium miluonense]MDR6904283.1 hypothetical protein [Rhizobium miluonense]
MTDLANREPINPAPKDRTPFVVTYPPSKHLSGHHVDFRADDFDLCRDRRHILAKKIKAGLHRLPHRIPAGDYCPAWRAE